MVTAGNLAVRVGTSGTRGHRVPRIKWCSRATGSAVQTHSYGSQGPPSAVGGLQQRQLR
jgi:hypothetical protein